MISAVKTAVTILTPMSTGLSHPLSLWNPVIRLVSPSQEPILMVCTCVPPAPIQPWWCGPCGHKKRLSYCHWSWCLNRVRFSLCEWHFPTLWIQSGSRLQYFANIMLTWIFSQLTANMPRQAIKLSFFSEIITITSFMNGENVNPALWESDTFHHFSILRLIKLIFSYWELQWKRRPRGLRHQGLPPEQQQHQEQWSEEDLEKQVREIQKSLLRWELGEWGRGTAPGIWGQRRGGRGRVRELLWHWRGGGGGMQPLSDDQVS